MSETAPLLPRPLYAGAWTAAQAPAARAFWDWHLALWHAARERPAAWPAASPAAWPAGEAELDALPVPPALTRRAREACQTHGLDEELLAAQAEAARSFTAPLHFPDAAALVGAARAWAGSLARLLGGLAGARGGWQQPPLEALGAAVFLTGRLLQLPDDARRGLLFLPLDELAQAGLAKASLGAHRGDPALRRILWKHNVRIRDLLVQAQPLARELPRRPARALRQTWFGVLAYLDVAERRGYDVWTKPIALSPLQRAQVHLQTQFSKAAFRAR